MSKLKSLKVMFHVEKMQLADLPFAVKLANTMKWGTTMEDFDFNMRLEPEGCWVLFDGQNRVGIATCINYGSAGWFGNLVVSQKYKKMGAGTFLLNHAISYLQNKGATLIGLYAYPHLQHFYEKMGFKPDKEFVVLKAKTIFIKENTRLNQADAEDLQKIVEFDRQYFGAARRKVLEQIFLRNQNFLCVTQENNKIIGYAAAKIANSTAEVGPLVCIKKRPEEAAILLKAVLSKLNGAEGIMYLPATQEALIETAASAGFQEEFRLLRMFLGSHIGEDCWYLAESLERG
ncbi:MAG: GNAT family N-acetyltransferase [Candidatus Bathyarchaeota archaeon]|nr:GNAT family N-acetyltransferase [Candidatus Bathyarchaeota archaeon]